MGSPSYSSAILAPPLECMSLYVCVLSHVRLFMPPWAIAHQDPLAMKFSWQEYWSGLPFPPPRDLPDPGTEPHSLVSPSLATGFFTTARPEKPSRLYKSD